MSTEINISINGRQKRLKGWKATAAIIGVEVGRELQRYTGHHRFLFPGIRRPSQIPISAETINKALKIMGFGGEQTGHGFRGLANTIMNERSGFRPEVIESQLAHKDRNKVRRAYNHAVYLDERRALMQWWSDYLDEQLALAKPIPPKYLGKPWRSLERWATKKPQSIDL